MDCPSPLRLELEHLLSILIITVTSSLLQVVLIVGTLNLITMFFCLPIFFGCQTQLQPVGQQQSPKICPRCHNASVIYAKSTTWFELFFIPVVPFSKKHIWLCGICQWRAAVQPGDPGTAYPGQGHQSAYAPVYVVNQPQKQN